MKNILIFNDISGLGNCSMCANLPIFTKLGHYCMPIVTASFSCQTGFEKFTCQKNENLPQCAEDIVSQRIPDAVYVGFCVDCNLLEQVCTILGNIVEKCSQMYVFVDPILGDNGKLYSIFNEAYLQKMKKVTSLAQCITPNLTEACLLSGTDYAELVVQRDRADFLALCGKTFENFLADTGAKNAVITGVECGELIGNIVLEANSPMRFVTNDRVPVNFSGTGDTFSSVLLGELLNGASLLTATEIAADFVCKSAKLTKCADRRFGVEFSRVTDLL